LQQLPQLSQDFKLTESQAPLPGDIEASRFRDFIKSPQSPPPKPFQDSLFARVYDALNSQDGTTIDVMVLIRQVLRRASERDEKQFRLTVDLPYSTEEWSSVGVTAVQASDRRLMLEAEPWRPTWLGCDGYAVDRSSLAGSIHGRRARFDDLPADDFFEVATGHKSFRTAGQRAAVRAAVSMPGSSTLVAMLPTGSGKTEIALTIACHSRRQTTIIVVPTVALAYDLERRFRDEFGRVNKRVTKGDLVFAWTYETSSEQREQMKQLLATGGIPILVTSPESLTGALLDSVRVGAEAGRIRALVIDEAHLVTQWGRDFRPEFRNLANLRSDLLSRCDRGGHPGFLTILLSATLGPVELADLHDLFSKPGPLSLVAANSLRSEPEYWIASAAKENLRRARVLEALKRLPRPLILYVTRPARADEWERFLKNEGFGRVAVVTGHTAGDFRRDVLGGLRAGLGSSSRYDVVIATSAFGLGIDNEQIRSVVHACLPETLDRWYQEVGRSGRDGNTSAAVLLPGPEDHGEAASLGTTVLKPDTAETRWKTLWSSRRRIGDEEYVDLHLSPQGSEKGSYNRRWNAQVLKGLEELDQIERVPLAPYEAADCELPVGNMKESHEWEKVTLRDMRVHDDGFFDQVWEPWRQELIEHSSHALASMREVFAQDAAVCELLATAYRPKDSTLKTFGDSAFGMELDPGCGRCPACRSQGVHDVVDPPPRGRYSWATAYSWDERLRPLLNACPSSEFLALLHSEDPLVDGRDLADLLLRVGVKTVAGVEPSGNPSEWWFRDSQQVHPTDLPPLPAFVVPPVGERLDQAWLTPLVRPRDVKGHVVPAVLLVQTGSLVGVQGLPVERHPSLSAHTARMYIAENAG